MTNKRAVIYCRVSTKEQVDDGNSLITQEKICREYALTNAYDIIELFIEKGESAKTTNRTELQKLLAFCDNKKNEIHAVIVYKIDRLSRNTDDYGQIRLLLKRRGIEIRSTSETFEDTPAGRFMENIIANVAQFDNDVRTERSIGGSKEAMREGRYVWRAPYGYLNAKVYGKSTIVPSEKAHLVTEAFLEVSKNYTAITNIHSALVKRGLLNKQGKPLALSQFYELLKNEIYAGWIIKFKERHKGLYQPLVSEEIFSQVQRVVKGKYESPRKNRTNNPEFPLRKFIRHSSGIPLTGSWSKGRRSKYPYYFFRLKGCTYKREHLENIFVDFLNTYCFSSSKLNKIKQALLLIFGNSTSQQQKEYELSEAKINDIKRKQTFLVEKSMEGIIQDSVLKEQLQALENEIAQLKTRQINQTAFQTYNPEEVLTKVANFLKNPGNSWLNSTGERKIELQRFYFPNGVIFDGANCRTDKMCSLFKLKSDFYTSNSSSVPNGFKKSNTPEVVIFPSHFKKEKYIEDERWNDIANELVYLSGLNDSQCNTTSIIPEDR